MVAERTDDIAAIDREDGLPLPHVAADAVVFGPVPAVRAVVDGFLQDPGTGQALPVVRFLVDAY